MSAYFTFLISLSLSSRSCIFLPSSLFRPFVPFSPSVSLPLFLPFYRSPSPCLPLSLSDAPYLFFTPSLSRSISILSLSLSLSLSCSFTLWRQTSLSLTFSLSLSLLLCEIAEPLDLWVTRKKAPCSAEVCRCRLLSAPCQKTKVLLQ